MFAFMCVFQSVLPNIEKGKKEMCIQLRLISMYGTCRKFEALYEKA